MKPGRAERGSILVEALVAVLIVAAMAGLWFETLGGAARQQRRAADARLAMLVAQSQMATVGVINAVAPGVTSGSDAGYDWRIEVEPQADAGPGLDRVTVAVDGRDGRRRATLASLRPGR